MLHLGSLGWNFNEKGIISQRGKTIGRSYSASAKVHSPKEGELPPEPLTGIIDYATVLHACHVGVLAVKFCATTACLSGLQ